MAVTDGSLEKRIKRRVIGRTHEFFAATAPGLEPLCRSEVENRLNTAEGIHEIPGGVIFHGRVHDGYAANLHLRTANRVLMRITDISATHFRKLERELAAIPWELFLPGEGLPEVKVSAFRSRLMHTGAIAERCRQAIHRRLDPALKNIPASLDEENRPAVFIRGENDRFTLSVDSSGALLYKRGLKQHGGPAPLRETLAAAILMMAGYDGAEPLIDPMSGTGTFALEAAMMRCRMPPGWLRAFAFEKWPCFRPQRWLHIRREAESNIISNRSSGIWSSDRNATACAVLETAVKKVGFSSDVRINCRDFFDLTEAQIAREASGPIQPGLIVLNPPYGRRLDGVAGSKGRIVEMIKKLSADFGGWRFALLAPGMILPEKYPCYQTMEFPLLHGGLNLKVVIGRINGGAHIHM